MIDALPRNSAYHEAMCEDERLAELILLRGDGDAKTAAAPHRRVSDYSPTVELLTDISDRITELIRVTAVTKGGKPGKLPYAPRPRTAIERVRRRREMETHTSLVARLLPHKQEQPG